MYFLGKLYQRLYGCSCVDDWYLGEVPEHWNEKTAGIWMERAKKNRCLFCENPWESEMVQAFWGYTEMLQYADWDDYYRRGILESSEEMICKEEFVRYAMSVKHSASDRKALAKKAAEGDVRAKGLLAKSYISVIAGRLYQRYPGQWIPKAVPVKCINALYEYIEKMDVSSFDNQLHYKSSISRITDDVCVRHIMEKKGKGKNR